MSAIGNHQIRHHLLLRLLRQGVEGCVEVFHRYAGNGLVSGMFRQPGEMLIEQFGDFLFEEIDQAHLSGDDHAAVVVVQPLDQSVVFAVVDVQPLVAGDDAHLGQFLCRETEQGFGNRYIDVYRSFPVMVQFEQGFVDQAVAIPLVFVGMYLRQVDGLLDQRAENTRLRKRLPVHLSDPRAGTVCRDHDQRHLLVEGFRHSRMDVQ